MLCFVGHFKVGNKNVEITVEYDRIGRREGTIQKMYEILQKHFPDEKPEIISAYPRPYYDLDTDYEITVRE